ncbi:type IV conjugative transfer system lipoprotein TraV [Burkholderia anthina]|uniref:type IV conjugative transfer system lipoprotein TraV n=1 Tax=Burkholderia anthina TaxID=179879 RepID=UPI001FC8CE35|nr:type IV conjugative transfer system lipoprotein TraV [Burkholderia anthina]
MEHRVLRALRVPAAAAIVAVAFSGCSSFWSVGNSDFDCPGIPQGVICKTPREVYQMTNHRDALLTMHDNGKQTAVAGAEPLSAGGALKGGATVTLPQPIQQPLPLLEPAQVMRIWINSWIDQNGDLHYPGFVYTEVTPRRWAVGNVAGTSSGQVLAPVQIDDPSARDTGVQDGDPSMPGGVIAKPPAIIQPYAASGTSAGAGGPGASSGPIVPGLPVPDRSSTSSSSSSSSPFSRNFSGGSSFSSQRPMGRNTYSTSGQFGSQ